MTGSTSGTNFFINAPYSELFIEAFERIGKNPAEITDAQMNAARRSINLILTSEWSSIGPMLWKITSQTVNLSQGTYQITLPTNLVSLLDCYVSIPIGNGTTDYILYSMSRSEYVALPNKLSQARPTAYWLDKLTTPVLNLWQVPDQSNYYTLTYYYLEAIQDADVMSGQTADVHFSFLEALCANLAVRLAVKYAPEKYQMLKAEANEMTMKANAQNREIANLFIGPNLSGFYRGG